MRKLLRAAALCIACACHGASNQGSADAPADADSSATFEGPQTRFLGRVQTSGSQTSLTWGGSSVLLRFSGSDLTVKLATTDSRTNYFDVLVDGSKTLDLAVTPGVGQYTLRVADGTHTVRIIKRNEASFGTATYGGATTTGRLLPTATPNGRFIEFVGDSITNGYGALGAPVGPPLTSDYQDCTASGVNESATLAFAIQTALATQADYSLVAVAGRGVARNADGSTTGTLPQLWTQASPLDSSAPYVPASKPSAVVINLGTNDLTLATGNTSPPSNFVASYVTFLQKLRTTYPQAALFLCVGPMLSDGQKFADGNGQLSTATSLLNQVLQSFADSSTFLVSFPTQPLSAPGDVGCEYHPSVAEHQTMATVLTQRIKQELGW